MEADNCLQIFKVRTDSEEFKSLEKEFTKTQPSAKISKIERIQHRRLWRTFRVELQNIAEKHGTSIEEVQTKMLYHGTSGTDPQVVYNSEEGLDLRFSNDGFWGRGIYFAVNSSYSNSGFSFKTVLGERQMFCAQVIIGKAKKSEKDNKLKMPPLIEGTNISYDCI